MTAATIYKLIAVDRFRFEFVEFLCYLRHKVITVA